MKYTPIKLIAILTVIFLPAIAFAVTDKEMEEARTIAAKAYLRYANDGSGYLDDLNPKTMKELEAALKTKEKENIKAFKSIPVPQDYKSWNKDKLVEYWAVTAFQNKGLLEKGRGGRIRARSLINKMTVSSPQKETPAPTQAAPVPVDTKEESKTSVETPDTASNPLNILEADEQAVLEQMEEEEDLNVGRARNYTWVYIMVLVILVAIVIALVVYASNVMKKNGKQLENPAPRTTPSRSSHKPQVDQNYEALLADKNVEIAMLRKKLEAATRHNSELRIKIENLTSELKTLQTPVVVAASEESPKEEEKEAQVPTQPKTRLRTIYLGRANSRGIFIRADRTINPGHSIFVLETSDGFTGSYHVIDSPAVWSLALSNPQEYLETVCMGRDLGNAANATQIVTESPGTAVFEGGCWRVIRKTRIRYE